MRRIANLHGAGQSGLGVAVFVMVTSRANADWNPGNADFLGVILVNSAVMIGAVNFLVNMIAIWEPSAQSVITTLFSP